MRFSPAAFDRFLTGPVGQSFLWRRAAACPCVSPGSGSADPECPLCDGLGWSWGPSLAARAAMTAQSTQKAIAAFGSWEPGDATLTLPRASPVYAAGRNDRVRSLDSTTPFNMVLRRGHPGERLIGSLVAIERVFWRRADKLAYVEGAAPAVNAQGRLSWPGGVGEPPAGQPYSISGVRHDEWFVFNANPSDRNIGVGGLPRKVGVRRMDLFGRGDG